ncbi:MAG: DnaJ domain-containing protein [Pseudomonadota bacterium]|nr:DnaJ domain-containing protein [Pseudomonadota bacterium]
MDRRDLDEIERFLTSVGRPSLFAYYGVESTAPPETLDDVVKKRRTWAQGQQSNPKYKFEALFLIKSNGLLRRVMLEQLDEYRAHVMDDTAGRNLDVLSLFIRGTLSSGALTSQAEAAILHQGRQLDLADTAVARRLEEILAETGLLRDEASDDDVTAEGTAIDHYAILGVATNAQPAAIEDAYRNRYRWARSLKDLKRSSEVLHALDEAWRMLSDPKRRVRYDERRLEMLEVTDEVEKRAAALIGLLGGPRDAITGEAPLPGGTTHAVHEVGFQPTIPPSGARAPKIEARGAAAEARSDAHPTPTPPPRVSGLAAEATPMGVARAPAPPAVSGRTIGITGGPQTVATLGPRLAVDGPEVIPLNVGARVFDRTLIVRNVGQGKMPGRVTSDREWLKIRQPRLDPMALEQQVVVTVLPTQMPRGRTAGTITVVTDHGERRTLTLQANRQTLLPYFAALAAVAFGTIGLAALALFLQRTPPATVLALSIDPVADRVLVDGTLFGLGGQLDILEPQPGKPFVVRIEADGFAPREETITLPAGERTARVVKLDLTDDMQWTPAPDAKGVARDAAVVAALQGARPRLAACFAGASVETAEAVYTTWITGDGQVRRVDVTGANFDLASAEPCIRRTFRGLRLPPFAGDYAAIEERLSIPVPTQ